MTPIPSKDHWKERRILDPASGDLHVRDILNLAKDGVGAQDHMSDHVIGTLILAKEIGVIKAWELQVFQAAFVQGGIRKTYWHFGKPFLGPDGRVLTLKGRKLVGDGDSEEEHEESDLTLETLKGHPDYDQWLTQVLYTGLTDTNTGYNRTKDFNSIEACDQNVNSKDYNPGPYARELTEDEKRIINGKGGGKKRDGKKSATASASKTASNTPKPWYDEQESQDDDEAEASDEEKPAPKHKLPKSNKVKIALNAGGYPAQGGKGAEAIAEMHKKGASLSELDAEEGAFEDRGIKGADDEAVKKEPKTKAPKRKGLDDDDDAPANPNGRKKSKNGAAASGFISCQTKRWLVNLEEREEKKDVTAERNAEKERAMKEQKATVKELLEMIVKELNIEK